MLDYTMDGLLYALCLIHKIILIMQLHNGSSLGFAIENVGLYGVDVRVMKDEKKCLFSAEVKCEKIFAGIITRRIPFNSFLNTSVCAFNKIAHSIAQFFLWMV